MTQGAYYLKWIVMDQFDFKKFTFDHPSQVQAFKEKIWSDLSQYDAVSLQSEAVHLSKKKLCVFDMDSTVINQEVIDEIARLFGLHEQVSKITEAAMQGKIDFVQSLQERCRLFQGMPESRLKDILPRLSLSPGAQALMETLRRTGVKTGIVSGGFEFVLRHFQSELHVDRIHAHTLEVDSSGQFLGNVKPPIIDASRKRELVSEMKRDFQSTTEQTIVVGDGANDLEMMKEAGISVSFCGKPKLMAEANTLILKRDLRLLERLI